MSNYSEEGKINVWGARVHNLKNIDVEIPRGSLTVITGLSGSGKSSLAFDTIYAEGQRRYIETFSAYARNFLGGMERPDVDKITGLSPVISIEQKTTNRNPRSTVGTTTEIYDYMRLLYARAGVAYSYNTGERMVKYTEERIIEMINTNYAGKRIYILAPLVRQRKGHYRELFESLRKKGFLYVRVDGEICEITSGMKTDRYKNHNIEVVVDKMLMREGFDDRLKKTIETAMRQGDGIVMILDKDSGEAKSFSKRLMCPTTGISYRDPAPNIFSFNSPEGACPHCKGLGYVNEIDMKKVIPDDSMSIHEGAIAPLGKYKNQMIFWQIAALLEKAECTLKTPVKEIPDDTLNEIMYGSLETIRIDKELVHTSSDYFTTFDGVIKYLRNVIENDDSASGQKWADQFLATCQCPECHGQRLSRESLSYRIWDKNISEVASMDISQLNEWLDEAEKHLDDKQHAIATEILKEIRTRLNFLLDVGLDYLSLNRQSATLSGGESQRIRLATQIGSQLVNVLYILDEPSIGLHQRDNERLIHSLKQLRDMGNTVVVVEHDKDMMLAADWIIDIGPMAGMHGGEVVFQGTPQQMLKQHTITSDYLNGVNEIAVPTERRKGNGYKTIEMNFLPDVMVPCEVCHGKRYNRETLEVRYKGKSIADVLDMTINQAVEFFENVPAILQKIKTIQDVGLGYIKLGQPSTTLSGGESPRVKLATELSKRDTGKTLYILDEPTTGLHFEDIRILMNVLQQLVDRGNTVIIIEHNLDVIKLADHIIDIGPEGGSGGGRLLIAGTPEEVAESKEGYTPKFLKMELENK